MTNALANNFCSQCGNALVETAVICPKCGSPTARFHQAKSSMPANNYNTGNSYAPKKTKSTAVILAIFFGPWAYLYTYKKDVAVFWVSMGVQIFFFFALLSARATGGGAAAFGFIAFIFWLISLITSASRTHDWYMRYPNN